MGLTIPLINGDFHSYADIELSFNGLQFAGVTSIDYDDNLNRAKVRGTQSVPLGLTKGAYEANGEIEMLLEAWNLLQFTLNPLGGWRQLPLYIGITYAPGGIVPLPIVNDVIPAAYLGKLEAKNKVSDDPVTRRFSLHIPGQILWGGVSSVLETNTLLAVG
jgi:hypothetical protein